MTTVAPAMHSMMVRASGTRRSRSSGCGSRVPEHRQPVACSLTSDSSQYAPLNCVGNAEEPVPRMLGATPIHPKRHVPQPIRNENKGPRPARRRRAEVLRQVVHIQHF